MKTNKLNELRTKLAPRLERIQLAIRENRAYLETFMGRRLVTAYNYDSGEAITNNTGSWSDRRSFLVGQDQILTSIA